MRRCAAFIFGAVLMALGVSGPPEAAGAQEPSFPADEADREWSANRDLALPVFGQKRHTRGRLDEAYDRSRRSREPGSEEFRVTVRSGDTEIELSFEPTLEPVI